MKQVFNVPLYIRVGKKKPKNVWLNLSNYRNWYHHQNNSYKREFHKAIQEPLQSLKPMKGMVDITLEIFYPTKARRDLDNTSSVITKFVLDCLVEEGILPDDSIEYIRSIHATFKGYDKDEPRAVITLSGEDTEVR